MKSTGINTFTLWLVDIVCHIRWSRYSYIQKIISFYIFRSQSFNYGYIVYSRIVITVSITNFQFVFRIQWNSIQFDCHCDHSLCLSFGLSLSMFNQRMKKKEGKKKKQTKWLWYDISFILLLLDETYQSDIMTIRVRKNYVQIYVYIYIVYMHIESINENWFFRFLFVEIGLRSEITRNTRKKKKLIRKTKPNWTFNIGSFIYIFSLDHVQFLFHFDNGIQKNSIFHIKFSSIYSLRFRLTIENLLTFHLGFF